MSQRTAYSSVRHTQATNVHIHELTPNAIQRIKVLITTSSLSNSTLPLTPTPPDSLLLWRQSTKKASYWSGCRGTARKRSWSSSSSSSDGEPSVTDGSCWSELTGGVAVVEALVLALPRRGFVEVVAESAEEVSTSKVMTAEAVGYVDCGTIDSSPPPLKVVSVVQRGG